MRTWFAWRPVLCQDGRFAWLRRVWCRYEFLGPRSAALGAGEGLQLWRYYRERPQW